MKFLHKECGELFTYNSVPHEAVETRLLIKFLKLSDIILRTIRMKRYTGGWR